MSVRGFDTGSGVEQYDYEYLDNKPEIPTKKSDIGLGNVDNTSDLDKPISTATQTALNEKVPNTRKVNGKALSADVTLTSGDIGYDGSTVYDTGTVGKELNELNRQISELGTDLTDLTELVDTKAPAIYETVSGEIASFADGADGMPVKSLIANIEPVQDLHGYDAPWPEGGGKNKIKMTLDGMKPANREGTWSNNVYTCNGLTFTVNVDDAGNITGVIVNGTATGDTSFVVSSNSLDAGSYVMNGCPSGGSSSSYFLYCRKDGNVSSANRDYGSGVNLAVTNSLDNVTVYIASGSTTSNLVFKPMVRLATETDATFSPYSNICPISGHTGASVTRTGVNLFDKSTVVTGYVDNDDGVVKGPTSNYKCTDFIPVKEGLSYYVKSDQTTSKWGAWYDSDKNYITGVIGYANAVITAPSGAKYVRLTIRGNVDDGGNVDTFGVNYPSTDTAYHAYQGTTLSITFPSEAGTVYGGTLDVTNGVLTVDRAMVTYDGSNDENWLEYGVGERYYCCFIDIPNKALGFQVSICNEFLNINSAYGLERYGIYSDHQTVARCYFRMPNSSVTTKSEFVEWIAENPIELAYKLSSPITYQLTESEISGILETLYGTNNIWADVGTVDVEYPADTKLYIDGKIAEAIANALNA